jgi:hypothetical protein
MENELRALGAECHRQAWSGDYKELKLSEGTLYHCLVELSLDLGRPTCWFPVKYLARTANLYKGQVSEALTVLMEKQAVVRHEGWVLSVNRLSDSAFKRREDWAEACVLRQDLASVDPDMAFDPRRHKAQALRDLLRRDDSDLYKVLALVRGANLLEQAQQPRGASVPDSGTMIPQTRLERDGAIAAVPNSGTQRLQSDAGSLPRGAGGVLDSVTEAHAFGADVTESGTGGPDGSPNWSRPGAIMERFEAELNAPFRNPEGSVLESGTERSGIKNDGRIVPKSGTGSTAVQQYSSKTGTANALISTALRMERGECRELRVDPNLAPLEQVKILQGRSWNETKYGECWASWCRNHEELVLWAISRTRDRIRDVSQPALENVGAFMGRLMNDKVQPLKRAAKRMLLLIGGLL